MMGGLDIAIILTYLLFALSIGIIFRNKASGSLVDYFLAGRRLPALWLALSIVATTFASDTPLAVTGIIANSGIAGNWLWWITILNFSLIAVYFASRWRRAGVLTDVELLKIRYAQSKWVNRLRITKAFLLGVALNVIIMSWVILAMTKIVSTFLPAEYQQKGASVIVTYAIVLIVVLYSFLSGLYGVVVTDLVQITIVLVATYALAGFVINESGGWSAYLESVKALPAEKLSLFPADSILWFFYLGFLWWATYSSDGTGYIAQRVNSAKDEQSASAGTYIFIWAHFVIRMIPWLIVALFAIVSFPDFPDKEQTYVLAMKEVMPAGWLGLGITALVAAFMSTMDTHLNWGASYVTNDIVRLLFPDIKESDLLKWGKAVTVFLAFVAGTVSLFFSSITQLWLLFFALSTGIGVANLIRWFWWRANKWTEWTAIVSGLIFFIVGIIIGAGEMERIAIAGAGSLITAIVVTVLTKPEPETVIQKFEDTVKPVGLWRQSSTKELVCLLLKWLSFSALVIFTLLSLIAILLDLEEKWYVIGFFVASFVSFIVNSRLCKGNI